MSEFEIELLENVAAMANTGPDWWVVSATLVPAFVAILAIVVAGWRIRKNRDIERKEKALVIVKPRTMLSTYWGLLHTIVMEGWRDSVLLFSDKDAFEFIDYVPPTDISVFIFKS